MHCVERVSIREISRRTGLHRKTVRRALGAETPPRWQRLANGGARVQRLLWASTSTKDPDSPDTMYIDGLRAPHTINTMPESTLRAFADHGRVGEPIAADGGGAEGARAEFELAGIDVEDLAATLQSDGAENFVKSWEDLLNRIDDQVA